MRKTSVTLFTALCAVSLLGGCSQADQKPAAKDATSTSTSTATATDGKPQVTTTMTPSGQKQIKISLESLPDSMVICTVGGNQNITIGDYRRMLKIQQAQAQANIANNAVLRANMLQEAQKRGLTLTADEKSKLVEAEKSMHKDFPAFLKEKNMTEAQFNKEIESAGLVFKMSNAAIEEGLLANLVSRQLLASATTDPTKQKQANEAFDKLKKQNNTLDQLRKQTGLTDADIKSETVKAELARFQVAKLEKSIRVSDREIADFYKKNASQLKHNERIRMARIVVQAAETTQPPYVSVKEQVQKANPKLQGKELDDMVANVIQQQQQKALVLLGEAKAIKDFGRLANENTEDPISRLLKNGGDMGWQEKQQLVPQFAEAVWSLPPGTVLPKLVKTGEGFSIIKVTAHEKPGTVPLSEVRPLIEAQLKQQKLQATVNQWVNDRQKTVKVEFAPKFLQIANGGETPKIQ